MKGKQFAWALRAISNNYFNKSEVEQVSGEQISYSPKPKAWSYSWQVICLTNHDILRYFFFIRSLIFWSTEDVESLFEPICSFHTRAWFQLGNIRILLAGKHLFVGSYLLVTWWALKKTGGKIVSNDNDTHQARGCHFASWGPHTGLDWKSSAWISKGPPTLPLKENLFLNRLKFRDVPWCG